MTKFVMTIVTGHVPNLPWWKGLNMTDTEIKTYNDGFLTERVVEFETGKETTVSDIVEMLQMTANKEFGTYDVNDDSVRVGCQTLRDAATEITRLRADIASLRSIAGPVSIESGLSLSDIKASLRP